MTNNMESKDWQLMKALIINGDEQLIRDIIFCLQVRYPEVSIIASEEFLPAVDILETESPFLIFLL